MTRFCSAILMFATALALGCGSDPNKNLKPIDPNAKPPGQAGTFKPPGQDEKAGLIKK